MNKSFESQPDDYISVEKSRDKEDEALQETIDLELNKFGLSKARSFIYQTQKNKKRLATIKDIFCISFLDKNCININTEEGEVLALGKKNANPIATRVIEKKQILSVEKNKKSIKGTRILFENLLRSLGPKCELRSKSGTIRTVVFTHKDGVFFKKESIDSDTEQEFVEWRRILKSSSAFCAILSEDKHPILNKQIL